MLANKNFWITKRICIVFYIFVNYEANPIHSFSINTSKLPAAKVGLHLDNFSV